jgi:hypothetical protein
VYALIVERLERHVLTERHVAAVMQTINSRKVAAPTFETELQKLDRLLQEAPRKQYDGEQAALIAALGLGEG